MTRLPILPRRVAKMGVTNVRAGELVHDGAGGLVLGNGAVGGSAIGPAMLPGLPNVTAVGSGVGETTLMNYNIPLGLLANDGDMLVFDMAWRINRAGQVDITVNLYGYPLTDLGGFGPDDTQNNAFARVTITRLSPTILIAPMTYNFSNSSLPYSYMGGRELSGLDVAGTPWNLYSTGQSIDDVTDDVQQILLAGRFYPARSN